MKNILFLILTAFISINAMGQSNIPQLVSFSALVRDANNQPLVNTPVSIRLTFKEGGQTGPLVYCALHQTTTNQNGFMSLQLNRDVLGTGCNGAPSTLFEDIPWENGGFWMEVEYQVTPGDPFENLGQLELASSFYAFAAGTAESISGMDLSGANDGDVLTYNITTGQWEPLPAPTNEPQQLSVSTTGDTLHLQNGGFVIIPGISAANASGGGGGTYPTGSVFCSSGPTEIVDVTNPTTGKIWMDRNLGATQAATSSTDVDAYGDLYQWGRFSDGHQCRTSNTTATLSCVDQPAHGDFILAPNSPYDWRSPQNDNLWQGVNGINNPCPSGYRIPTDTELDAERLSWSANTSAGALASPLKLPMAGSRKSIDGSLNYVGTYGYYWSSTVSSINSHSRNLYFLSSNASMFESYRTFGSSVRCIKD